MADRDFVKAQVMDVRKRGVTLPEEIALDANILYFVFYPNLASLRLAGCQVPHQPKIAVYNRCVQDALDADAVLSTSFVALGEFVRTCEYAEFEAIWRTHPQRSPEDKFSPLICKVVRYEMGPAKLATIRRKCQAFLQAATKVIALLDFLPDSRREQDRAVGQWIVSAGDYGDATLVADAFQAGISNILTDDFDLVTFEGITVYTDNLRAINAAKEAGKLLI